MSNINTAGTGWLSLFGEFFKGMRQFGHNLDREDVEWMLMNDYEHKVELHKFFENFEKKYDLKPGSAYDILAELGTHVFLAEDEENVCDPENMLSQVQAIEAAITEEFLDPYSISLNLAGITYDENCYTEDYPGYKESEVDPIHVVLDFYCHMINWNLHSEEAKVAFNRIRKILDDNSHLPIEDMILPSFVKMLKKYAASQDRVIKGLQEYKVFEAKRYYNWPAAAETMFDAILASGKKGLSKDEASRILGGYTGLGRLVTCSNGVLEAYYLSKDPATADLVSSMTKEIARATPFIESRKLNVGRYHVVSRQSILYLVNDEKPGR